MVSQDDYYSPHPRLVLARPLALTGHPGSSVAQVGRVLAGLTGLAFNQIERAAEAAAGASRSRIVLEHGWERLRELERAALRRALARRPFGLIVMESGLLEDGAGRQALRRHATTIHLQRPFAVLCERIAAELDESPGRLPEFLAGRPATADELRDFLVSREKTLSDLDCIFESSDRHPIALARDLLALLPDLGIVESRER